jgi:hypothetical protein
LPGGFFRVGGARDAVAVPSTPYVGVRGKERPSGPRPSRGSTEVGGLRIRGRRTAEPRATRGSEAEPDRARHDDAEAVDRRPALRTVTWLILPVVICLSQRLSHACLSISESIQRNCEWLIKSVIVYLMVSYYLDNRGNSRANTCERARLFGRAVFIRYLTDPGSAGPLVNHNNSSDRTALSRRRFIQISALSTFDGRIEAYHGFDG